MLKSLRGRLILIAAVVGISLWSFYSNGLNLGLDLLGGMHLALEIDDPDGTLTPEARSDGIDRVERIIRTRIDEFGVSEPLIQKVGTDRLIVELAGISDPERAKDLIRQSAFLEWKLVGRASEVDAALARIDRAIVSALGVDSIEALGRAVTAPEAGAAGSSIEELLFQGDTSAQAGEPDTETVADTVEEAQDPMANLRPFSGLLNRGDEGTYLVAESDVRAAELFLSVQETQIAMPRGLTLQFASQPIGQGAGLYRELYVLERDAFLTGDMLEGATAGRDPQFNQPQVQFQLSRIGGRRFGELTGQHIGDRIAIILDGEVVSAPVVRDRIGARGQIDLAGSTMEEAVDLALVLRAGALPAPVRILEERTVGPSLGQDSIDQGRLAGIVGIILVILVMALYYRVAGVLAIAALGVYVILVMGGLAAIGATLTLPGIAGLILSVGMAVDANVLIFERIREELDNGRPTRNAVDEGFGHALSAIVDSNITTLLTALILFQFGTGPVRGFAVTLSIGIVASFFTAIFVTRAFFLMYVGKKKATDPISI
jgi:preprotein translocase subunit SecD